MARFDIWRRRDAEGYLLECQADLLSDLSTRFVVPLLPAGAAPQPAGRLNPTFVIEGTPHIMVTQFAAAVRLAELGGFAGSLACEAAAITNALDLLITGV